MSFTGILRSIATMKSRIAGGCADGYRLPALFYMRKPPEEELPFITVQKSSAGGLKKPSRFRKQGVHYREKNKWRQRKLMLQYGLKGVSEKNETKTDGLQLSDSPL